MSACLSVILSACPSVCYISCLSADSLCACRLFVVLFVCLLDCCLLVFAAAGSTPCATPSCGAVLQLRRLAGQFAVRLQVGEPGADEAGFGSRLCTNVCTQMFVKVLCTYDLHPCARQRHTCIHTHLHVHTRTYVHSFTHSLTHSLIHSLTHSLTHSCLRSHKEGICTHFGVRPISGPCERSKVPETST